MFKIGNVEVNELVERFNTPLYVYDENKIIDSIREYKKGLQSSKYETLVIYASKAFACLHMYKIAKQENITLTDEHWLIVHFVRDFYQEFNTSPAIRMLVKAVTKAFGEEKGNSRYLYRLFPDGPAKQATKIAGLPKPVKCI